MQAGIDFNDGELPKASDMAALSMSWDRMLDARIAAAADRAMRSVDAETDRLFRKYGIKRPPR